MKIRIGVIAIAAATIAVGVITAICAIGVMAMLIGVVVECKK
jgi:hypothetical protein